MSSQNLTKAFSLLLLAFVAQIAFAQKVITGKINDANGNPLRGANITVKGSRIGTQTTADGTFRISVDNTATTLVVSSVGFTTQEVSIQGKTAIDISMVINSSTMGEVVIIGYGTA